MGRHLQMLAYGPGGLPTSNHMEKEERQRLHRQLQQIARVGAWQYEPAAGRLVATEGFYQLVGLPPDTRLCLRALLRMCVPAYRTRVLHALRSISRGDRSFRMDLQFYPVDNPRLLDAELVGQMETTALGATRLVGTLQEVTQAKQQERSVLRARQTLRVLFENVQTALLIVDPETWRIDDCNREALRLLGAQRREQLVGKLEVQFRYQPLSDAQWQAYRRTADEGGTYTVETEYLTLGGEVRWIHVAMSAIRVERTRRLLLSLHDFTERRRAEEELRNRDWMLREAERLGRLGGWQYDLLAQQVTWSDEVYRIHGLPIGAALPPDPIRFFTGAAETTLRAAFDRLRDHNEEYELDLPLVDAHGQARWVRVVGKVNGLKGAERRLYGIIQDITTSKTYEQQLERINESKDRILAAVVHDLRNPIDNIKGLTELLRFETPPSGSASEYFRLIEVAYKKVRHLINELLELSDMESDRYRLNGQSIPLADWLAGIVAGFGRQAEAKGLRLHQVNEDGAATVWLDQLRFARVVENLLSNSLKFTPPGGQITVRTSVRDSQQRPGVQLACLEICDTGIGVPQALQPIIFDKFSKARRLGLEGEQSTGLGMSIVKRIVELHGGRIWLESTEGEGTTFFITLPVSTH